VKRSLFPLSSIRNGRVQEGHSGWPEKSAQGAEFLLKNPEGEKGIQGMGKGGGLTQLGSRPGGGKRREERNRGSRVEKRDWGDGFIGRWKEKAEGKGKGGEKGRVDWTCRPLQRRRQRDRRLTSLSERAKKSTTTLGGRDSTSTLWGRAEACIHGNSCLKRGENKGTGLGGGEDTTTLKKLKDVKKESYYRATPTNGEPKRGVRKTQQRKMQGWQPITLKKVSGFETKKKRFKKKAEGGGSFLLAKDMESLEGVEG